MYKNIILIPIGGVGSRFKQNDYKRPKTLINIFGKPIIYYLLDNLKLDKNNLIYIVYNHEYKRFRFEEQLIKDFSNLHFQFYHLIDNTQGASETINIGLQNLNLDYDLPILCLDSDNFYTSNIIEKWNHQNSIFYFNDSNDNAIYSYINLDKNNDIIDIIEKEKISNNACCGAYGFNSYKMLLEYTTNIIHNNIRFKKEFYTSVTIKQMIQDKIIFKGIYIDIKDYHCIGTPLQLKQFYNNFPHKKCIDSNITQKQLRICFDLDNTLVTYPKIKDDYKTVEPITKNIELVKYLKSFNHTIIIYTARRMKTHQGNQGKLLADIGKITFDTLDKFEIPYDEIYFGKPQADFYIDDNAINAYDDIEKEMGFYLDMIKPRDFNSIDKNTIEIYTKKSNDLSGEIYYYQNIPPSIKDMFPLFIDYDINNKWYSIEKINGITLSIMYLSELVTPELILNVMNSIKRIHNTNTTNNIQELDIYSNYKDKLKHRYENYDYSQYPKSKELYEYLYNQLQTYENKKKGKKVIIHGDTVFTNIITNQYQKIKFIDMRGIQGNTLTLYGDWLYDWAKFYQSLIGYDEILLDKEINKDYKLKYITYFEKIFVEWYGDNSLIDLKLITKSLLFTLIPLHNNNKCIKYYNLINSIK